MVKDVVVPIVSKTVCMAIFANWPGVLSYYEGHHPAGGNPWSFRGSVDRHLGRTAPQTSHYCVVVVGQALQPASPPPPCPARLDERLPDPTCLSTEPLTGHYTSHVG